VESGVFVDDLVQPKNGQKFTFEDLKAYLITFGWSKDFNKAISLIAVDGIPSSALVKAIIFMANTSPVST
jgi:hypothetical protein